MESIPLEMDDIFGDQIDEDEEQMPQMLPDLPDSLETEIQGTQNDDEAENQEVLKKLKKIKGAAKNTVRRPMPKLDTMRLTGERGIPILPRVFQNVKLRGKNHEVEDLRVVMRYLEHWAHRLFPMMPFDEVLERIERLGTKREVQTCIKKMRLGMPVLSPDEVTHGDDKDSDADGDDDRDKTPAPRAEDLFDAMLHEGEEEMVRRGSQPGGQAGATPFAGDNRQSHLSQTPTETAVVSVGLTPEMMERMERNKRLAMERRARSLGLGSTPFTSREESGAVSQEAGSSGSQMPHLEDLVDV